ncbi:hypothetical protein GCM10023219_20670 [Stakelama sediminis]|uniref:Outer membrane protein beta-barrel domain-containing protein n=1 Tax=Stakelama sediminis TaxID=463200 RepID=A0A840Z2F8_9SPHN|nr:hypothetical protein [Stakelama sediminis]MBB5719934.1 hypothetical protein [Stakelama sediminis]
MKRMITAAMLLMTWGIPTASAQIVAEANGARVEHQWGGELGVGYRVGTHGFSITPTVGAFIYHRDNGRYYMEDNGGNPACRDQETGQYADKSRCTNLAVRAYGRVEASYHIPRSLTLGGGVRIGEEIRPYGILAFPLAPKLDLKANAGPHYYAAGVRFNF